MSGQSSSTSIKPTPPLSFASHIHHHCHQIRPPILANCRASFPCHQTLPPPLRHCQPPTHNQNTRFMCRDVRVHHYHHYVQPRVLSRASMSVSFIKFPTTTV
ncbi:hypothetical protein M6B38_396715 [Iris pallida]|uniref:Uncharacterized protein n=1 Tax=Iris pallida TaxID=29817 RepID=A0AAX6FWG9_IRIPA|nr:hypothetical protein M6B38_396715 [Iris pallida]